MDNFTNLLMDECPPELQSPDDDNKGSNVMLKKTNNKTSKGVAMSFGFKRRPNTAIPIPTNINNSGRNSQNDPIDSNGNGNDEDIKQTIKYNGTTTKLPPPKKEGLTQQKISRFGFRQPRVNRTNKVNEMNTDKTSKNIFVQNNYKSGNIIRPNVTTIDNNRNRATVTNKSPVPNQVGKFILQTTQLPKPQSVRVFETTKTAKTLMNNNTKIDNMRFRRFYPSADFSQNSSIEDSRNRDDLSENTSEMEESFEAPIPKLPSVFHSRESNDSALDGRKVDETQSQKTQKLFLKPTAAKSFLKTNKLVDNNQSSSEDQEWDFGGEAMAEEPSLSLSLTSRTETNENLNGKNNKLFVKKILPLKSECMSTLLDDETSPVESLLSFTESDELRPKKSPDTKNATSPTDSSSISEGKDDFLIDDEIADQPGLVFDDKSQQNSERTLIESTPRSRRKKLRNFEGSPLILKAKKHLIGSALSLDTLSPCESIASDDLMMDYDFSQNSLDENDRDRIKNEISNAEIDETLTLTINSESDINIDVENELKKDLWTVPKIPLSAPKPRYISGSTPHSSPCRDRKCVNLHSISSPLGRSSISSHDSEESIVKLDKTTHSALKNDIINVKAMLLKLRRVLNESETQNPLEQAGGSHQVTETNETDDKMELAELKRQLLFLQGMLEDKEKTVQNLQKQLSKMCVENQITSPAEPENLDREVYNAATQTDRIRPSGFIGPTSLTSPGSLMSVTEWARKI